MLASRALCTLLAFVTVAGCSSEQTPERVPTRPVMNWSADLTQPESFYDAPYPSDLRLVDGKPDLRGFRNVASNVSVNNILEVASDRPGFPVVPVA